MVLQALTMEMAMVVGREIGRMGGGK